MMTGLLLIASLSVSQPKPGLWQNGPVELRVHPAPDRGAIALPAPDELKIELHVRGSDKLEVQTPTSWITSRGWRWHEPAEPTVETSDGKRLWSFVFNAYPISPGEFQLQLASIAWKDGDQGGEAKFEPIAVRSFSTLDRADIRDLRDPVMLDRVTSAPRSLNWPNALLTLLGVSAGIYLALRGARKQRHAIESPELRALRSLDRVRQWHLPEKGKAERHFTLLSLIARRYLERKHDLPALRRTTPEFLDLLKERDDLAAEHAFIVRFFDRADRAKFAPESATVEECRAAGRELQAWLESKLQSSRPV